MVASHEYRPDFTSIDIRMHDNIRHMICFHVYTVYKITHVSCSWAMRFYDHIYLFKQPSEAAAGK